MHEPLKIIYTTFQPFKSNAQESVIHLSETIQQYLKSRGSKVVLDKDAKGELDFGSAYIDRDKERGFMVTKEYYTGSEERLLLEDFYLLFLKEGPFSLVRAKIKDLQRLADLIFDWMEVGVQPQVIAVNHPDVDLFKPLTFMPVGDLQVWNIGKNQMFSATHFYNEDYGDWLNRYDAMLDYLSQDPKLAQITPRMSHGGLLFGRFYISPSKNKKASYRVIKMPGMMEPPEVNALFNSLEAAKHFLLDCLKPFLDKFP